MTPQSSALTDVLRAHFPWHLARIKFVSSFIITLLVLNTINLTKLASWLNGRAKRASNYRRLQRFFKDFDLDEHRLARLILVAATLLMIGRPAAAQSPSATQEQLLEALYTLWHETGRQPTTSEIDTKSRYGSASGVDPLFRTVIGLRFLC